MNLVDEIRRNGAEIERLSARIKETLPYRWTSRRAEAEWSEACRRFHERYGTRCFPGGAALLNSFAHGDPSGLESAIAFIVADVRFFRSGYIKELVRRKLTRFDLSPAQLRSLEAAGLGYLRTRVHREFWHMVNFMRRRGSAAFWSEIQSLSAAQDIGVRLKARWLLLARENRPVRRWLDREVGNGRRKPGYEPSLMFDGDAGQKSSA